MTTGGDSSCNIVVLATFRRLETWFSMLLGGWSGARMKERGVERRPMKREREKLRVASVARNMPRRRREKQWIRR